MKNSLERLEQSGGTILILKKCVLWVQNNGFWLFKKTVNHLNNPHKNPRSLSGPKSLKFGFFMFGGDLRGVLGGQGCGMCELLD